jgi:hypothetical protein
VANELEQLQLTVTLVDNASAGLARLQQQLDQLTGREAGGQFERVKRDARQVTEEFKKLKGQTEDAAEAHSSFGRGLGVAATAVGGLGLAFYKTGGQLNDFAQNTLQMNAVARSLGLQLGQFKSLQDQLSAFMTPEEAARNITNFAQTIQEWGRLGSRARFEFIRAAGGSARQAEQLVDQLVGLQNQDKLDEAINLAIKTINNSVQEEIKRGVPAAQAAREGQAMAKRMGLGPEIINVVGQLRAPTPEEIARERQRLALAQQFSGEWNKVTVGLENFESSFKKELLPLFGEAAKYLNEHGEEWGKWAAEFVKNSVDEIKKIVDIVQGIGDALRAVANFLHPDKEGGVLGGTGPGGTNLNMPPQQFFSAALPSGGGQGFAGTYEGYGDRQFLKGAPLSSNIEDRRAEKAVDTTQANTEELKSVNERLGQILQFGGLGGAGGGGGASGGWGGGGRGPYGSDVGSGNARGANSSEGQTPEGQQSNTDTSSTSAGVPGDILANAHQIVQSGGGASEVFQYMRQMGYPKAGAWCGEFTAAVVKGAGYQPPKGAAAAGSWAGWGTHATAPSAGMVAVRRGYSPRT